jgi:AraC-like DNA-binding protein
MQRFNQHEPFNIYRFDVDEWPYPLHNHSYFEIIFIEEGVGIHCINEHRFDYQAGDVFLLGPQDSHIFEIHAHTHFCYLRFTEFFFQNNQHKQWQQMIEYLFHTPYQTNGSLVRNADEKQRLRNLLTVLMDEYEHRQRPFAEQVVTYLMQSILSLLARTISEEVFRAKAADGEKEVLKRTELLDELLAYVRHHIYSPEKLRLEHLAERFHYSPNYLSIFFKRHMGQSLQQYIVQYKLKLVETRLRYSNWSISQIAYELGFSDESHLTKLFKKYYHYTPGEFRKQTTATTSG